MKEKDTILIADDDPSFRQVLTVLLEEEGFRVMHAVDGNDCMRLAYARHPDLILLDIMMPHKDGREVCRRLREVSDVPIIMLTCVPGEKDKVERLSDGADDYVTKPFSNAELIARMKTVLRRTRRHSDPSLRVYDDGYLKIDFDARQVSVKDALVTLTSKEWLILEYFLRHRNRVVTHHALLRHAWGDGYDKEFNNLKVYIARLRRKLNDPARRPRYIHTERGMGYRFETHA
ncbi:MAG: response regulator transcription factor [Anaerolineales bacterium]|nr:response regulator transcription factor [Anaerolineales bacterium]